MNRTHDTLVLCYHAVSREWPSPLAVRPDDLRAQVASLLEAGYQPTTFTAAVLDPSPGKTLVVTFDDAYRSTLALAAPVLTALGVPGTLFVPTDFPDSGVPFPLPGAAWIGTEYEDELSIMGWDEVREIRDQGWEIGAHTCSHPWLTQINDQRLRVELAESRSVLAERLGEAPRSIAYPFGDHDDRVVAAAAVAGYEAACTVPHRFEHYGSSSLRFGRIDVTRDESRRAFRARTSALSRRSRATKAGKALLAVDQHRPRRSTVLAAIDKARRRRAQVTALRSLTADWHEPVRRLLAGRQIERLTLRDGSELRFPGPDGLDLDRFARIFVERRFPVGAGDRVVEVGAADDLFEVYAGTAGAAETTLVDAADPRSLEEIVTAAPGGTTGIDLLVLDREQAAAEVVEAKDTALEPIGRIYVRFGESSDGPRADEVVHRLGRAGFETELELDPAAGGGYIAGRRSRQRR